MCKCQNDLEKCIQVPKTLYAEENLQFIGLECLAHRRSFECSRECMLERA